MDISLIIILLILSMILLFLGLFKKQLLLLIFSGIALMLMGVGMFTGIENTVTVIFNNEINSTITNQTFTVVQDSYSLAMAIITSLLGLTMILISSIQPFTDKKIPELMNDE